MMEWFVVREGKTEGPYLDSQFHHLAEEGAIIPTDLVWYTGTERKESIPACEVHNFFAATPSPAWLADHIQSAAPKSTGDSQILSARRCSYLRRHWRGDLSLELTFWLNGAVFFFSLYTLPIVAPGMITARGNLVRTWIYFLGFLAALTVVSVWQVVGIWRSAGKHRSRGGKSVWVWAARIMVALFVLNNVERVARNIPVILDVSMALFVYDRLGAYQIRLLRDGTELEVSGTITFGITKDVLKALDSSQIKVIHLNSIGGRMREGHELQKLIRARSLITYTTSECSSACTIAFLGGQKRLIAAKARLGFHHPAAPGLSQTDLQAARADWIRSLIEAGVSANFAYRAFSVPNTEIWYPTPQELLEAGVVTDLLLRPDSGTREAGKPDTKESHGKQYCSQLPCT